MEPGASSPRDAAPQPPGPGDRRRPGSGPVLGGAGIAIVIIVVGAIAILPRFSGPVASPEGPVGSTSSVGPGPSAAARPRPTNGQTDLPVALPGSIAVVDSAGSLTIFDPAGHRHALSTEADVLFGFPAWSPDGSRIAVVRSGTTEASISIFGARQDTLAKLTGPVVVYRNAASPPFYLYWEPDGRRITFLATETNVVSLRVAPADGSSPLDGSGPGALIRSGAPLYFDWVGKDRLLLHVGTGSGAYLGEIGLDGTPAAAAIASPGDFRAAVVSSDQQYVAYVRTDAVGSQHVVVAARVGSVEHVLPVFGATAVLFDPAGDTAAMIGPDHTGLEALAFPIGPLRVIDAASGTARTLLDGTVVGFFWSPDGRTIAALRLQPVGATSAQAGGGVLAAALSSPTVAPSASPQATEVRLLFVDVASGKIRSQAAVQLGGRFVNEFLPYFDQYALSHRLWAPDSSSLLLPLVDDSGTTHLVDLPPDGGDSPFLIDGEMGIWSP